MGYLHIDNLYKNQTILLFRECYALEKIHGTSAHISWKEGQTTFFSGGEKHERFQGLFDGGALGEGFTAIGHPRLTVYGEAYGGKQQAQAWRYGPSLRFVAFDVLVGDWWLSVPQAADVASKLGLDFVSYERVSTDLEALHAERDAPSTQAVRNGVAGAQDGAGHPREGVVLRPIVELSLNGGGRIIAKHKRDDERETRTPRAVVDPAKLAVLTRADDIAAEWVTPTRLEHVLDKLGSAGPERTREVIDAMIEDIMREGLGEIVESREARQAISKMVAVLFKKKWSTIAERGQ